MAQNRILRDCKESWQFLRTSALRPGLQHGYDLPRKGSGRPVNQPQNLFHVDQRSLELPAKVFTLKVVDDSSYETAFNVCTTTSRCKGCRICGEEGCARLKSQERTKEAF